jgi:hypothetical protein
MQDLFKDKYNHVWIMSCRELTIYILTERRDLDFKHNLDQNKKLLPVLEVVNEGWRK